MPVQSVGRATELLGLLAPAGEAGLALRELAAATGLKPTTAHSLLRSLQAGGLVEQAPATARYRLGVRVLQLAAAYLQGSTWLHLVEFVLQELNECTKELAQLGALRGDQHVSLRVLPSLHAVVAAPANVAGLRLHCTSMGKVLLAWAPPARARQLLDQVEARGLVAYSPTTITDRHALEAELARVRAAGYASNYEEGRPGVVGQAAPVRDLSGATVAALGVAYPAVRRTPAYDARMTEAVLRAAAAASHRLGWQAGVQANAARPAGQAGERAVGR